MVKSVLLATMSLGIGGAETHIIELALELKRRGTHVSVASNGGVYVAELISAGIPHHTVPMDRRSIGSMIRSFRMMRRIIKREKPDIVHAHARIPGFICGLLRKTMRFHFVTMAHGVFDVSGSLRYLTNWGEKTIAVSEDIRRYLSDNYGVPESDIFDTVNSIDAEKFSPDISPDGIIAELGLDASQPVILNVSRLDAAAAVTTRQLISLAPAIRERVPGAQLVITGDGDVMDELSRLAASVNSEIGERAVIMTGERTDIGKILSACDLFVGVSRAALEALASAKPVILAGSQGYIGLFGEDKLSVATKTNFCGRGLDLASDETLLSEITRFFSEVTADEKNRLGAFGRELVLRDYSVGRMTDDCIRAYEAALCRRYRVVLSGYYGFKNAGDEAILQSIRRSIERSGSDVDVTVLSFDPADTKSRYGCDAVDRFKIFKVLKTLRRCDVLISGGGSLLQDYTSTRSLLYYLFIIRAAKRFGKKVMLYANGIGPVNKKANRRRVRRIVSRADVITLRDEASLSELRAMGVEREDMSVTADPVFMLSGIPESQSRDILRRGGVPDDKPFILVSIRDWADAAGFRESVAAVCDGVFSQYGRNVVFISMQSDKDVPISREVSAMMANPSYVLEGRFTAEEIMGMAALSDMALAMRLHALIFAARVGVPFAGIVYDPKVLAYTTSLEMPVAGDVRSFDSKRALMAVSDILDNRDEYAARLSEKAAALEAAAYHDSELLFRLLRGR